MAIAVAVIGLVGFDDPICGDLGDCPSSWHDIGVANVLDHTSGSLSFHPIGSKTLAQPEEEDWRGLLAAAQFREVTRTERWWARSEPNRPMT